MAAVFIYADASGTSKLDPPDNETLVSPYWALAAALILATVTMIVFFLFSPRAMRNRAILRKKRQKEKAMIDITKDRQPSWNREITKLEWPNKPLQFSRVPKKTPLKERFFNLAMRCLETLDAPSRIDREAHRRW